MLHGIQTTSSICQFAGLTDPADLSALSAVSTHLLWTSAQIHAALMLSVQGRGSAAIDWLNIYGHQE